MPYEPICVLYDCFSYRKHPMRDSCYTYDNAYLTTFNFNSDVEFATSSAEIQSVSHNDWKHFDGEADGSNVKSLWDAA